MVSPTTPKGLPHNGSQSVHPDPEEGNTGSHINRPGYMKVMHADMPCVPGEEEIPGNTAKGLSQDEQNSRIICADNLRQKIIGDRPADKEANAKEPSCKDPSIWKVPPYLRNEDVEAYQPKLISIGPLHHTDDTFSGMKDLKLECLRGILKGLEDDVLDKCVNKVFDRLTEVKDEYSETLDIDDGELAEMLVVDGLFIIWCMVKQEKQSSIACPTSLYRFRWLDKHLRRDLLLLENQIPFFIISELFETTVLPRLHLDLMSLACKFLDIEPRKEKDREEKVYHLLHLQHLSYKPPAKVDGSTDNPFPKKSCGEIATSWVKKLISLIYSSYLLLFYVILFRDCSGLLNAGKISEATMMVPSARKLRAAGIKFKKKERKKNKKNKVETEEEGTVDLLNISFTEKDGTLEIPRFRVSDSTCSSLRNYIAFEQCYKDVSSHFTEYCVFMDFLIDTAEDVVILQENGILDSMIGSDNEVAVMFNGLCTKVIWDQQNHYLTQVYKDVHKFCQVPHHRWRADLIDRYFNSPWAIFSAMTALILVVFTVTQTFATLYPRK